MSLQVGQKGDAYHIYPLFTSGGGSFFGTTATGDPDPSNVTVDSAGIHRGRREDLRPGREGRRRAQALRRRQERHPAVHRRQDPFLVSGPWAIPDIEKAGIKYDICADPGVRGRQAGVAVHRRQRLLSRQQGQEQDARPGVPHERRADPRLPGRPVRGRPAPAGADRSRRPRSTADRPQHPEVRGTPVRTARSCPRSRRWARSGARSASPRPPSSAARIRRRPSRPPPRRSAKGSPTSSRRAARCGRAIREGRAGRIARPPDNERSWRMPAPRGVTEEERSGDCDIHHAALRPGRRQHARAAREDPAARRSSPRSRSRRHPARRQPGVVLADGAGPGRPRRIFFVYLQPWHIPLKYIVPGTIFLVAFQVVPVVSTFGVSFTNFGDGHRGTKDDAITAIEGIVGQAGAGLGRVRPDDRDRGRRRDRQPDLPALRPDHEGRAAGTEEGLTPCTGLHRERHGQGQVRGRPDVAQPRPGGGPDRRTSRRSASPPTTARSRRRG